MKVQNEDCTVFFVDEKELAVMKVKAVPEKKKEREETDRRRNRAR
jgi:hypothetical protein